MMIHFISTQQLKCNERDDCTMMSPKSYLPFCLIACFNIEKLIKLFPMLFYLFKPVLLHKINKWEKFSNLNLPAVLVVIVWQLDLQLPMQSVHITLWDQIPLRWGVLNTTLYDEICQWLAAGPWFSLGTLVSSTNKTDRHDITEILLKVGLNTISPSQI